jgi:hypothetical protein
MLLVHFAMNANVVPMLNATAQTRRPGSTVLLKEPQFSGTTCPLSASPTRRKDRKAALKI